MNLESVVSRHVAVKKKKLGLELHLDLSWKKGQVRLEEGGFYRDSGVEKAHDVGTQDVKHSLPGKILQISS